MIARMRENRIGFPNACVLAISFQARMTSPDLRQCCGFAIAACPAVVARTSPTQAVDTIRRIRDMASPDVMVGLWTAVTFSRSSRSRRDGQVDGAPAAKEVISFVRWRS
jgi:hypothetical protein